MDAEATKKILGSGWRKLKAILDALPIGVAIVDAAGEVLQTNQAMQGMWEAQALLPRSEENTEEYKGWWSDTGDPVKPDDWPHERVVKTGEGIYNQAMEIERADGIRGNVLVSAEPLYGVGRDVAGVAISVQNVTSHVEMRRALEMARQDTKQPKSAEVASKPPRHRPYPEHDSSHVLQRALLPEEPAIGPGYNVAHAYVAGEAADIGGDFYDTFATGDGKVGILIGDVSGMGPEAAALAAATRSTVRAFAYELSSPGQALCHTNDVLVGQTNSFGEFVTVFLVVLDPATGEFRYASAGHPPAAIYHTANDVEFIDIHNTVLGVWGKLVFDEGFGQLKPGEKMVLYTDGISEARRGSELFGAEGLAESLVHHGSEPPSSLASEIFAAANAWAQGEITDDVAVLVIERCAA